MRDAEQRGDAAKRELLSALRAAFVTPMEPEDLFALSRGIDRILNYARDLVNESEAMACAPDEGIAEMAALLAEALRHLDEARHQLGTDGDRATEAADAAIGAERGSRRSTTPGWPGCSGSRTAPSGSRAASSTAAARGSARRSSTSPSASSTRSSSRADRESSRAGMSWLAAGLGVHSRMSSGRLHGGDSCPPLPNLCEARGDASPPHAFGFNDHDPVGAIPCDGVGVGVEPVRRRRPRCWL